MYSSEGEFISFNQEVDTNAARGNVDEWLLWTEERMLAAVHTVTEKAYNDYGKDRAVWVIGKP